MPKFCPKCEKSMEISTITGKLLFKCPVCAEQIEGDAYDVKMPSAFNPSEESTESWINIINNAPFDRVSQIVGKSCINCPRNYMTQLRLGQNERIVYSCKCGYNSTMGQSKLKQ